MPSQSLEANDFTGGMTDNFIAAGTSYYQQADNLFIADDKYLNTRPALKLVDVAYPRVSTLSRIGKQFVVEDTIVSLSDHSVFYKDATGFHEIFGPTGNLAFDISSTTAKYCAAKHHYQYYLTNDQFPQIVTLTKDASTWTTRTLGLPKPVTSAVVFAGAAGGPYSYIFRDKVTYSVNGVTYEELSGFSAILPSPHTIPTTITGIATLTNTNTSNYDTANKKTIIYRNILNGSVFYKVGEVANGVTTFTDNTQDAGAQLAADIFDPTNVAADVTQTPRAKYIHQVNDILWLIQPQTNGVTEKSKLRQCVRFEPYNAPGDFEEDFDAELTGISSVNIYPLVFTRNSVYRIEGYYQINGAGGITKRRISDTVGCISQDSIVQFNEGVAFAAETGFYFTDGYKVVKISSLFNKTYRTYAQTDTQKKNIAGCYDQLTNKIMWTVQSDLNNDYADKIFVCHLRFGLKEGMPFTTWSGGKVDGQNFRPSSLLFYKDIIYMGDSRGYYLRFDSSYFTDDKITVGVDPALWLTNTVLYKYISPSFDFGSPTLRKWVTWLILNMDNISSVSLRASLANDNSGVFSELAEIKYKSNISWLDPDLTWLDPSTRWNYSPTIATKRRIPPPNRCSYKQLMLENSYSLIDSSVSIGVNCVIDAVAKTATITAPNKWLIDCEDYYLELPFSTAPYKVLARTDQVLTLEDLSGTLSTGTYAWNLKGYRRDEVIRLIEYTLVYMPVSMSQEPHTGAAT